MKIFKIIVINILIIAILFFIIEFVLYINFYKSSGFKKFFFPYFCGIENVIASNYGYYPPGRYKESLNILSNYDKNKKPILLLGCSYTYGHFLDANNNFAAILANNTHRKVYNWGIIGQSAFPSLLLLKNEEQKPLLDSNPEYIIYTYMFDHLAQYRWNVHSFFNLFRKYNYIDFQKYSFLDNLYTYSYYRNKKLSDYIFDDDDFSKRLNLFYLVIKDIKNQTDKLFPGSKFIFLIYSDINYDLCDGITSSYHEGMKINPVEKSFDIMYSEEFKEKLKSIGQDNFYVITTEELIGRKMNLPEDRISSDLDKNHPHPSSSAWEKIVPALIKKYDL